MSCSDSIRFQLLRDTHVRVVLDAVEYDDKLLKLVGTQDTAQERGKHPFADYATTWFETYSKPNIETVTATTYRRQLTRHLLPAFSSLTVEDITTDDIQRLVQQHEWGQDHQGQGQDGAESDF